MFRVMRERGIVKSRGANVLSLLARLLTHNPLGPYNYFEAICVEVIGLCEKSINVLLLIKRREGEEGGESSGGQGGRFP